MTTNPNTTGALLEQTTFIQKNKKNHKIHMRVKNTHDNQYEKQEMDTPYQGGYQSESWANNANS